MGLFVLAAVGVIVALLVRTSRAQLVERFPLFMRTEVANDLTQDTRVLLQGLDVGRVREVVPSIHADTRQLGFLTRLDINANFNDGTPINLPLMTTATISKPSPIAAAVVVLELPDTILADGPQLQPGDTILFFRGEDVLAVVTNVVDQMTEELLATIRDVRALLSTSTGAIAEVQNQVQTTTPAIDSILTNLNANLVATEALITDMTPRIGVVQDSALMTISSANKMILGFDSLLTFAQTMANENHASVNRIVAELTRMSIIMGHMTDQLSRRPTRILTGITPPPAADSVIANVNQ